MGALLALFLVLAGVAADAAHHHGHGHIHGVGIGVSLLADERGGGNACPSMEDARCGLCIFMGLRNYAGDNAAVFLYFGDAARLHRDEPGDTLSASYFGLKSPRSPPAFLP